MATVSENYSNVGHQDISTLLDRTMPGSPIHLAPLHGPGVGRSTRTVAAHRVRSPQSPPSPIAANRTTGRVALGPWGGPFNTSPVAIREEPEAEQTIYLSPDGRGHLELPEEGRPVGATSSPTEEATTELLESHLQDMLSNQSAELREEPPAHQASAIEDEGDLLAEEKQRRLVEARVEEALAGGQQIGGVAPALPAFAPRSAQRAERRACLDEHQLVGKKGQEPARLSCSPARSAQAQRRPLFQPRRGF